MPSHRRRLPALFVAAASILGLVSAAHPATALADTTGTVPVTVDLSSRTNPSVPGQHVIFDAVVTTPPGQPYATGSVTFEDGGTAIATFPLDDVAYAGISVALDATTGYERHVTAVYSGDAAFASATSNEVVEDVVGPVSADERYVRQLYNDILGRRYDSGYLISELEWGHLDRTQAAGALAFSKENVVNVVTSAYQRFLGRDPDPDGLKYWVTRIWSGLTGTVYPGMPAIGTDESLELSFLTSPEYVAAAQAGSGLVTSLYDDILGRDPDTDGLNYWTHRLSIGTPPAQLASMLLFSDESMRNRVTAVYLQILWRDPDPHGLDYWTSLLQHGVRDEELVMLLAGSQEYWDRTQAD